MSHPVDRRAFLVGGGATLAAYAGGRPSSGAPAASWIPAADVVAGLPQLLARTGVPGVALAVVDDGALAWAHGAGVRRAGHPGPVAPDTVFEGASLGKPVFAWGVLSLADAGALDLDRPLSAYLALPEVSAPDARRITARHVLTHTSGLPNWRRTWGPLAPAFAPGARFAYSGEGVFYLQRVVEHVTARPFAAWMRETVLDPLGMRDSSYVWRPAYEARLAAGHGPDGAVQETFAPVGRALQAVADGWGRPLETWTYADAVRGAAAAFPDVAPAGGAARATPAYVLPTTPRLLVPNAAASLFTTAADYARFVAHVLGAPAGGPPGGGPGAQRGALRAATRAAMFAPHVRVSPALAWGLGWGLEEEARGGAGGAARFAWHWGDNGSVKHFVLADLGARRAVVVLTNGANGFKAYERLVTAAARRESAALLSPLTG
jgi:CubicO group peptidase (beta-lactamase class C family)